jgi:deoxycytidylate deaminase
MSVARKTGGNRAEEIESKGSSREKVQRTYTDLLVIGLCAPIGSIKENVKTSLKKKLENQYGYEVEIIKISDFIREFYNKPVKRKKGKTLGYSELLHKIEGGNYLRSNYKNYSILAEFAITKIHHDRNAFSGGNDENPIDTKELKNKRICYIIDSLKNLEEIKLLRSIYRDLFYLFSIFSPRNERDDYLKKQKDLSPSESTDIIETDEYENDTFGQDVRNSFIEADFFVRASKANKKNLKKNIERYLNLIFESNIVTPLPHETAMYQAQSAAGNSACLSRQVGASITDSNLNILSKGWNDVPKFGGGLYDDSISTDNRCKLKKYCSNDQKKDLLTSDILNSIKKIPELESLSDEKFEQIKEIVRKSSLKNLIEFSRSVHAEMHAIINGSQLTGSVMRGGYLFCTTYPCHNCARHIVAAGISSVYYIEPYKKSLCLDLHGDSMTEDENEKNKVKILIYDGVAPRRFLSFFSMENERKNKTGKMIIVDKHQKSPKNRISLQALTTLEEQAINSFTATGITTNEEDEQ